MIVKMKKVTLLVSARRTNLAVQALRRLGLLHIKHMRTPHADYITAIEHKLCRVDRALKISKDFLSDGKNQAKILAEIAKSKSLGEYIYRWKVISRSIKAIVNLGNKKEELFKKREDLEREEVWLKEWGDVSLGMLEGLKQKGIFVRLHICSSSFLKTIAPEKIVCVLQKRGGAVYIAHVSRSEDDSLGLPEIQPPHDNLRTLQKKLSIIDNGLADIDKSLSELVTHERRFLQYKNELLRKLEFCKVRFGMEHQEGVACLQGFCPQNLVAKIKKEAASEGWATVFEDPDEKEEVPILIRNPKWVDIIKPVFKFMGTLPGYKEYDISFWFLLFFSLFFAMLIGDGGYGLILLGFTFFLRKKFKAAAKEPFFLMYVLSIATVIWGAISGTWFGVEKIAQLPILNSLVIDSINSFISSNQLFMIYLCFSIGAVHLTIAHGIIAFRFINTLVALAQVGWICIVWAAFFLAGTLVLSRPLPEFAAILGIIGVVLVVLFSNPGKNMLKGMAISLADLPLKAISSFSDIVSYLRLFAVGYATVTIASTFYEMALDMGFGNFFTGLIAAAILFLGHSLNIALGLMAVIVHGLRLNMLEFSSHLNMEWSGRPYEPFKE